MTQIQIGDKVRIGVHVLGKWLPMQVGVVVGQSSDRTLSDVDVMSLHGGHPWVLKERTDHLRHEDRMSADGGFDIPL